MPKNEKKERRSSSPGCTKVLTPQCKKVSEKGKNGSEPATGKGGEVPIPKKKFGGNGLADANLYHRVGGEGGVLFFGIKEGEDVEKEPKKEVWAGKPPMK